uniref:ATP synthase protein 8 n=1 Tax=Claviceps purpurea TaxID=5111 RepID=I7I433_CLAPU|nr:ATP synthase subunit 8 [Claviceps purpurea]
MPQILDNAQYYLCDVFVAFAVITIVLIILSQCVLPRVVRRFISRSYICKI